MKLIIIAAHSFNLVIGSGGAIPWNLPDDLKQFKSLTMGSTILMGRKTFESIGRRLPGRRSVVLTSRAIPGVETYQSLDEALHALNAEEKVFVIGGERLFRDTILIADELHLTIVKHYIEGDAFFPEYNRIVAKKFKLADFAFGDELEYRHYLKIGK
ncbi:MAG: dihydrofolate reductase [Bacteroidota bacterium]